MEWSIGTTAASLLTLELTDISYKPDSSVHIATGYALNCLGSIPGKRKKVFSAPKYSDRHWGPFRILSNGYWGSFPKGKAVET
jgi:hypothetical protein